MRSPQARRAHRALDSGCQRSSLSVPSQEVQRLPETATRSDETATMTWATFMFGRTSGVSGWNEGRGRANAEPSTFLGRESRGQKKEKGMKWGKALTVTGLTAVHTRSLSAESDGQCLCE